VLLVEDNPGDADLTREGLKSSQLQIELTVVVNGTQAINLLHKRGQFASRPTPDLILLDLNLPGLDGRAVLWNIKRDDELRHIPVCVLSSSSAEIDVLESYIPLVVFDQLKQVVPKDDLIRILFWVAVNPSGGDDSAANELEPLGLPKAPPDLETVRERVTFYSLKLLGRMIGKIPVK